MDNYPKLISPWRIVTSLWGQSAKSTCIDDIDKEIYYDL